MADRLKLYHLFAVDAAGVATATYEFNCSDEEEARIRARTYLGRHDMLELWIAHKRIARLNRGE
ncbi:hypothetical protein JQ604_32040 [Bradyrhizobium jicamae]|nr:hypothetical protein [Bradyrhizobium jicamae]MBR0756835.1 hypothetical protein [Bradyrhizobium jicamae]